MNYRTLGRTGLKVSEIGLGAWAIGGSWGSQPEQDSLAALHRAIDLGVNVIDTAAGYGDGRSERIVGKVLRERKERVYVATKSPPAPGPWPPTPYCRADERYAERYLRENVEERLRNLGTDTIDILQLHTWTRAWNREPRPPGGPEEAADGGEDPLHRGVDSRTGPEQPDRPDATGVS